MSKKITIDPLTRIEGHLSFQTTIVDGKIVDAKCSADLYRGIEKGLIGYDARVAQQVTQRICGVCPYAHAEASSIALEDAMGLKINRNGQLLRNLITGAYHLQDYLLHFYTLSALDFIDITAIAKYQGKDEGLNSLKLWVESELKSGKIFPAAPFLPRYKAAYISNQEINITAIKNYVDSIAVMSDLHKMVAIFGGKSPHPVAFEAGGITTMPTIDRLVKYETLLKNAEQFIRTKYIEDIKAVAKEFKEYFKMGKGIGDLLSYNYLPDYEGNNHVFAAGSTIGGIYEELDISSIREYHDYSFYSGKSQEGIKPLELSKLNPLNYEEYKKEKLKDNGKYSWARAPRYKDKVMEVGPVAIIVNTYKKGSNKKLTSMVDSINKELGITINDYNSVMGRHLCRGISSLLILDKIKSDLSLVLPDELGFIEQEIPKNASGIGMTEATRGALSHWIETDNKGLIKNYEMIVPTTWNISPRDSKQRLGAVEHMLMGTKVADESNPIELARIVRSTDPCMACSVH